MKTASIQKKKITEASENLNGLQYKSINNPVMVREY